MARGDGIHRTSARNARMKDTDIDNAQAHNEREKSSYVNQDIVPERTPYNVHFKTPTAGYKEMFEQMRSDGVISTRANMIQRAKELNMIAILRVFLIDSMALDSALSAKNLKPDAIDILPGLMPSMLRKVRQLTGLPILTGGLITEKKEVMQALEAGALAISSTAPAVWQM